MNQTGSASSFYTVEQVIEGRIKMTRAVVLTGLMSVLSVSTPLFAIETDQFSNRLLPVQDSAEILDRRVNEVIATIAADWRGKPDQKRFVKKIYKQLGGFHWVDKLERWVMESDQVDRLVVQRRDSIYAGHPIWSVRVTSFTGLGPSIRVDDNLIGSDKIGHFFSQGRKFYHRWLRTGNEARAARWSALTEKAIFGQFFTGSYSNADLVANYEGHRFYRSLFEDNIILEKPAILVWQEEQWQVQRPFSWTDHINDLWDEALHPNHYDRLLRPHMIKRLKTFCDEYRSEPAAYTIQNETALFLRYQHLGLRDTRNIRLSAICHEDDHTADDVSEVSSVVR